LVYAHTPYLIEKVLSVVHLNVGNGQNLFLCRRKRKHERLGSLGKDE